MRPKATGFQFYIDEDTMQGDGQQGNPIRANIINPPIPTDPTVAPGVPALPGTLLADPSSGLLYMKSTGPTPTTWQTVAGTGGAGTVGPGTVDKLARFSGVTAVGDASASDDGLQTIIPAVNHGFGCPLPAALPIGLTDDWNPWGAGPFTSVVRVQTSTDVGAGESILGGIVAPPGVASQVGCFLWLVMHGNGSGSRASSDLLIKDRSPTSLPSSRIRVPEADNSNTEAALLRVPYTGGVLLYYDAVGVAWITIGLATGGRFQRVTAGDIQLNQIADVLAAGNNNNYAPPGIQANAWVNVQPVATSVITGIDNAGMFGGGSVPNVFGSIRLLVNNGAADYELADNSAASNAGNRFTLPTGNVRVPPNATALVGYETSGNAWHVLSGPLGLTPKQTWQGQLTTNLAGGDNPDFAPVGFDTTTRQRLVPPGACTMSGMLAQEDGAVRVLTAYAAGLTLLHQSALSLAANRFFLPGAANKVIAAGESVICHYDANFGGWFVV